jgi:endoglucanase
VAPDGRVVRHDQGNDIVSEGQSYALVLAQIAQDSGTFDRVWDWTAQNLGRPDGLLSAHADATGRVDDPNAATDADLVIAWALLRDTGPDADARHRDGHRIADAILEHETVSLSDGTLVLVAGNWATTPPIAVNPSYWAVPVLADLGRLTGDSRWHDLAASSTSLVAALTKDGTELPPDWAQAEGSAVTATPPPSHRSQDVRYSFDAQRVVIWFAAGRRDDAAALAGKWAARLTGEPNDRAAALTPGGSVIDSGPHPTPLVAAAAAAGAAGRADERDRLLTAAAELSAQHPTYYGDAWVALGRALLTTELLVS